MPPKPTITRFGAAAPAAAARPPAPSGAGGDEDDSVVPLTAPAGALAPKKHRPEGPRIMLQALCLAGVIAPPRPYLILRCDDDTLKMVHATAAIASAALNPADPKYKDAWGCYTVQLASAKAAHDVVTAFAPVPAPLDATVSRADFVVTTVAELRDRVLQVRGRDAGRMDRAVLLVFSPKQRVAVHVAQVATTNGAATSKFMGYVIAAGDEESRAPLVVHFFAAPTLVGTDPAHNVANNVAVIEEPMVLEVSPLSITLTDPSGLRFEYDASFAKTVIALSKGGFIGFVLSSMPSTFAPGAFRTHVASALLDQHFWFDTCTQRFGAGAQLPPCPRTPRRARPPRPQS
jgi:hypothetical protein